MLPSRGEHEFIADYLAEEVLANLPEPVRIFLLQTSILERLTAALCEAVTGQPGAQAILHRLLDANLFILPLDERQVWFRYHRLFADLLRKRLDDLLGERVPDLHRRASCWFAENGMVDVAIEHAITGEDYGLAARLLEPVAESLLRQGHAATLLRWLEALPQETLRRPGLVRLKAFALFLCGRRIQQVAALTQQLAVAGDMYDFRGEC